MSLSNPKSVVSRLLQEVGAVGSSEYSPSNEDATKINQLHGIASTNALGAGIPKQVMNVQVSIANASTGTTCTVSIQYSIDPSDSNFAGVNIWVKGYQGNNTLVRVSSGTQSPAKFVLNNTGETVSFTVQAYGNGGGSPLTQAPTCSGTLPKSSGGGFGSNTTTYITTPVPTTGPVFFTNWRGVTTAETGLSWYGPSGTESTPGAAAVTVGATSTEPGYRRLTVGATATSGGVDCSQNLAQGISMGTVLMFQTRIQLTSLSNIRVWLGLVDTSNADPFAGAMRFDQPAQNFVGFRFSTNAGDVNWQCVAQTGSGGGAQTLANSGVAADLNGHVFAFTYDGTTVKFYIGATDLSLVLVGSIATANIPAASTKFNYLITFDELAAGTTTFNWAYISVRAK